MPGGYAVNRRAIKKLESILAGGLLPVAGAGRRMINQKGQSAALGELSHKLLVGIRLGPPTMVDVEHRQLQAQRRPQMVEDIQEAHGIAATGNRHAHTLPV